MNSSSLKAEYIESWALIVGINDYPHLPRLQGAVNDANAVAKVLKDKFGFPEDHTFVLVNQDATQHAILQHLELLAGRTQADDRVMFFFAGHGATREAAAGGNIGYVALIGSQLDAWATFMRIEDITRYSGLIAAKHMFFVFDACFSGLALTRKAEVERQLTDIPRWLLDCMIHRTRQALTAGLADQEVGDLTEDGHSIFTSYLLRALQGDAAGSEGEITATRVMATVCDRVMKDPRSQQKPAYGDLPGSEPGGDFVFQSPAFRFFKVPANQEGGVSTGMVVNPGQKLSFSASGVITYDSGYHYTNADGFVCTYRGQPLAHPQTLQQMVWPHPGAYRTRSDQLGLIGSLIGWVGEYTEVAAFMIGEKAEVVVENEGVLYLAVNDARGTYSDNEGEYEITVRIIE